MTAAGTLAAGGTVIRDPDVAAPSPARRMRLVIEIGLFFIVAPALMTLAIYGLRLPLFIVLQPVLAGFIVYLLWDRSFRLKSELGRGIPSGALGSILLVFALVAVLVSAYVSSELPELFLALPIYRPQLWLMVLILYPLLSVIAQELVYRTFFFHRYGPLFGGNRLLAVATNGLLFGYAHVIFYNWVAVAGTTLAGLLLAWRYTATRSFWAVWLEHALYGWLMFTVGLGSYFFTGISNVGGR